MTKQEEKRRLRQTIRDLRGQLDAGYLKNADRAIAAHLLALESWRDSGAVFCYVSMEGEVDTRSVLKAALESGKRLCVPRCPAAGVMELRQIESLNALSPGRYGILEPDEGCPVLTPDEVDFAVLPCVTCSYQGQRLGRGGGYYDRFLAQYRGGAVLVNRELLIRQEIPVEPLDRPVPWVLTERGLYEDGEPARL